MIVIVPAFATLLCPPLLHRTWRTMAAIRRAEEITYLTKTHHNDSDLDLVFFVRTSSRTINATLFALLKSHRVCGFLFFHNEFDFPYPNSKVPASFI